MNDQSQIMNQHQVKSQSEQVLLTNQSHKMIYQSQMVMNQSQMMNQLQNQPQMVNQQSLQMAPMVNQPVIAQPQMVGQLKMMGQSYGQWSQPTPNLSLPPMNAMKFPNPMKQMYGGIGIAKPVRGSSSWKGKRPMDKRQVRWKDNKALAGRGGEASGAAVAGPGAGGYQPPTLGELEQQNRIKARRFYHKKRFNRMGPYAHAPRNTTSFIIRAKKSGGIASLVSPCPVTPAVLPTPVFSPSREALGDMAKEEWGVDGYGSMKGLIRLRSPVHDETLDDYDEEDEEESSESDVEEHVEVERRLDHDLSRFEMIYPNSGVDYHNTLENRVDNQDTHITHLEEENLILKERLYLMERELGELRRRLLCLERQNQVDDDINQEVVENVSENDSEGIRSIRICGGEHNVEVDFVPRNRAEENGSRRDDNSNEILHEHSRELPMQEVFHSEAVESHQKDEQVQEPKSDVVQREKHDSRGNEDIGSTHRAAVVDEGVKSEPVRDDPIGEGVPEEVNEHDQVINLEQGVTSVGAQR